MRIVSRQPSRAKPARMAPLSVLPVFLDLRGRRAVVAGGSDAAAWKVELLAAAGADVEIVAPVADLGDEMRALLAEQGQAGLLVHRDARWHEVDLTGSAIAIADAASPAEAEAFHAAAHGCGVPVNIIDKPAFCSFQFGSIVNRSPVVVGISTSGAAPILGQAVRRRIETLLPPSLAMWAEKARKLREAVIARLAPGSQRRTFWEAFVDRAFGPPSDVDDLSCLLDRIASSTGSDAGRVAFVGAGPGDPELLTLKAVRALQAADIIFFDDLVSAAVLELARREAKRIPVGKACGRECRSHHDVNGLMLKFAKEGKRVVRLRTGDPMIFAGAGEEVDRIEEEGIPVDVVPGIAAATPGMPFTDRNRAKRERMRAFSNTLPRSAA